MTPVQTHRALGAPCAFGAALLALALTPAWAAQERAPVTRIGAESPRNAKTGAVPGKVDAQALIELVNQVERLQREVERLRGELEQQRYDVGELRNRNRDGLTDLDRRVQTLERGGAASRGVAGTGPVEGAPLQSLAPANDPTLAGPPTDGASAPGFTIEPGVATPAHPAALSGAGAEPPLEPGPATPLRRTPAPGSGGEPPIESGPATPVRQAHSPGAGAEPPIPPAPTPAQTAALSQGAPPVHATGIDTPEAAQSYRAAFNLLKTGKYDDAIAGFNNYLVEYPNGASVDNAQYWLGEAYFVMREFDAAIGEYQKLVNAYPYSQKAAHAELKIGYSLQELGQPDRARAQLERVIALYPGTSAARLADERLQQAGAAPPAR
jgi:tol-pal system protein YbgF